MLTIDDEQIRARLHAALEPITLPLGSSLTVESITGQTTSAPGLPVASGRMGRQSSRTRGSVSRVFVAAALILAVGGALALHQGLATQPKVSSASGTVVYTAAMVHEMAAATRAAVAKSGMAQVNFTDTLSDTEGSLQVASGSSMFTFSGSDLSLASQFTIVPGRQDGTTVYGSDTLRVVAGREYGWYKGRWYVLPGDQFGPSSTTGLLRPDTDPRLFLQTLSPEAQFQIVDRETIGGVELTHLRAANRSLAIPFQIDAVLEQGEPNGKDIVTHFIQHWVMRVPALDVWVDSGGVVHRLQLTASISTSPVTTTPTSPPTNISEATTQVLSLTFSHFGEREIISAPAHPSATLPICGYACIDNFYVTVPPDPQLPPLS